MTRVRASAGFGLLNLRPGSIILHCNSGSVLHQMSEFLLKINLNHAKYLLHSTIDVILHKNFDDMDPFGEFTTVEGLQSGYFHEKELKLRDPSSGWLKKGLDEGSLHNYE